MSCSHLLSCQSRTVRCPVQQEKQCVYAPWHWQSEDRQLVGTLAVANASPGLSSCSSTDMSAAAERACFAGPWLLSAHAADGCTVP